jgi:pyruvate-ferredoxin/flavodoxin oxidoreductase
MRIDYKKADLSKIPDFLETQTRFSSLINVTKDEEIVDEMYDNTQQDVADRNENYERLSKMRK